MSIIQQVADQKGMKVGDRGQRYEVWAKGWPKECDSTIGWSDDLQAALRMARAALLAPGCTTSYVEDRHAAGRMIERFRK